MYDELAAKGGLGFHYVAAMCSSFLVCVLGAIKHAP